MKAFFCISTASKMSEDKRQLLLAAFRKLKQRVLWKWETEEMPDKPDNVMLSKWLPQQDVLAHPNVRLFVSHGGQSSSQEALCHQKPVVSGIKGAMRKVQTRKVLLLESPKRPLNFIPILTLPNLT